MVWKRGCQPFSCRCSQNLTHCHCRKDACGTCLFSGIHSRHSFWEFPASKPYEKLEVPECSSTLQQRCIMVASCPSLRCSCRKILSHRDKQRVWSPVGGMASKICYNAVIVLSVVLCDCCKPMYSYNCRD